MSDPAPERRFLPPAIPRLLAMGLAGGAFWTFFWLHNHEEYGFGTHAWVFLTGLLFGWVLQRGRFCFFCMLRDYFEGKDSRAALAMALALMVGFTAHLVLFSSWIHDPTAGHLPPRAHIGPASWIIALGGLVFGVGMSMSGSCISAHLYRLGEGSLLSPLALLGAIPGAALGMASWNFFYLRGVAGLPPLQDAPVVWLPAWNGYALSLVVVGVVLGSVSLFLLRRVPAPEPVEPEPWTARKLAHKIFTLRWPAWVGGLLVGLLSTATLFRAQPLGVTAEINRLARNFGNKIHLLPERLEGLDGFRGCRIAGDELLFTPNALFVIALIVGGLIGIAGTGTLSHSNPKLKAYPLAFAGGILLGWGSFIALGCSIGTLLSGVHAGALSGWIFGLAMVVGVRLSLPLRWWAER